MKTRNILMLVSAMVLAVSLIAQAQPGPGMGGKIAKELNLSDEQVAKIKDLRSDHQKDMTDHQAAIKKARIDLRDLMTAEIPDKAAITKKMKEIADLRLAQENARVDQWFAVRSVLTPDQQKKWKEEFGPMMRERAARGFDRPGCMEQRGEMRHDERGGRQRDRMHW